MQETGKRIIEAARRVLIREGSNGFSLRKVAAEAGLSLSNVQYHYGTRTALLEGILSGFVDEYREDMTRYLDSAGDGREALTGFIREILADEANNDEIKFFRSLFAFTDQDALAGQLSAFYRDVYRLLRTGLARLSGKDEDCAAVHRAASHILPFLNGYGMVCGSLGLDLEGSARELSRCAWELLHHRGPGESPV